ncbi:MAG: anti-sigma factor [Actinomycetia bacterium]|nr:anti-sigma factor [Actinomycetes bacterium]
MTHESEVHTLAVPYALHALPDDEAEQFQFHLRTCASCQEEVDEVRAVAARLGAAESQEPPADLRRRVLEEIETVRPLPPVVERQQIPTRTSGPPRWWARIATAAAVVLLAVSGVLTSVVVDQSQQLDDNEALRTTIGQVAAASDMQQSAAKTDDGRVLVMSSRSQDSAVVFPVGMKPAPEGKDYQVWFMHGDNVRSAGLLDDSGGRSNPLAAGDLDDATKVGITVEPDGGSKQPTSKPVMLVEL